MEQSQSGTGRRERQEGGQSRPNGSVDGEMAATVAAMQQQLDTQLALSRTLTESLTSMLQQAVTLRRMLEIALSNNRVTSGGDNGLTRSTADEGSKGEHNQQPHKRQALFNGDINRIPQFVQPGTTLAKRQRVQSDSGKGTTNLPQQPPALPNTAGARASTPIVKAGPPNSALQTREPESSTHLQTSQGGACAFGQRQGPSTLQQQQAPQHPMWLTTLPFLRSPLNLLPNEPTRRGIPSALNAAAAAAAAAAAVPLAAPIPAVSGDGIFIRNSTASGSGDGSASGVGSVSGGGAATLGWPRLPSAGFNSPAGHQPLPGAGAAFSPGLQAGTPTQQQTGTPSNGSKHGSNEAQDSEGLTVVTAAGAAATAATGVETAGRAVPLSCSQVSGDSDSGPSNAELSPSTHGQQGQKHQALQFRQQVMQQPKAKAAAGVELPPQGFKQLVHAEPQMQELSRQEPINLLAEGNVSKQQTYQYPSEQQEHQLRRRQAQKSRDSNASRALLRLQVQQEELQKELVRCQFEQQKWQQRQEIQLLMQQQWQQQRQQQQLQSLQQQNEQLLLQQQEQQQAQQQMLQEGCKSHDQQLYPRMMQPPPPPPPPPPPQHEEEGDAKDLACSSSRTEPGPVSGSPVSVATPLPCMQENACLSPVNSPGATATGASQPAVDAFTSGPSLPLSLLLPQPLQMQLPSLLPVPVLPPPPLMQMLPPQPDPRFGFTGPTRPIRGIALVYGGSLSRGQCSLLDSCQVGDVHNGSTGYCPMPPFQLHSQMHLQRNSSAQGPGL